MRIEVKMRRRWVCHKVAYSKKALREEIRFGTFGTKKEHDRVLKVCEETSPQAIRATITVIVETEEKKP